MTTTHDKKYSWAYYAPAILAIIIFVGLHLFKNDQTDFYGTLIVGAVLGLILSILRTRPYYSKANLESEIPKEILAAAEKVLRQTEQNYRQEPVPATPAAPGMHPYQDLKPYFRSPEYDAKINFLLSLQKRQDRRFRVVLIISFVALFAFDYVLWDMAGAILGSFIGFVLALTVVSLCDSTEEVYQVSCKLPRMNSRKAETDQELSEMYRGLREYVASHDCQLLISQAADSLRPDEQALLDKLKHPAISIEDLNRAFLRMRHSGSMSQIFTAIFENSQRMRARSANVTEKSGQASSKHANPFTK
jgi:hypothetical protein